MTRFAHAAPHRVWFFGAGDTAGMVDIKLAGAATGGRFSQLVFTDPQGTETPLHVHSREDETMVVIEGAVTVQVGDARHDLGPGDLAFMPRGVPHAYHVRSPRLRALVTYAPAGFERFFADNGRPVTDPDDPPPPELLGPAEIVSRLADYGVTPA
jgi:quercetin dioxygenase-like cupin family protein